MKSAMIIFFQGVLHLPQRQMDWLCISDRSLALDSHHASRVYGTTVMTKQNLLGGDFWYHVMCIYSYVCLRNEWLQEYLLGGDWNMTGLLSHSVGNVIIPTDELIFFRGVGIPPNKTYCTWNESAQYNQVDMMESRSFEMMMSWCTPLCRQTCETWGATTYTLWKQGCDFPIELPWIVRGPCNQRKSVWWRPQRPWPFPLRAWHPKSLGWSLFSEGLVVSKHGKTMGKT